MCGGVSTLAAPWPAKTRSGGFLNGCNAPEVQGVRAEYRSRRATSASLLRPARGRLRPHGASTDVGRAAPAHPGRARRTSGATPTSCRSQAAARPEPRATSRVGLPAGCTPLIRADRLAERLGLGEVWVKNDAANPTHSFKDRVVVGRRRPRPRARLRRRSPAPRPATSPTRSPPTAPRWGWSPTSSSRPTSRSRRSSRPASTARTWSTVRGNYDDVNRLCTELSAERELGVRQRQHAPLLRRGLQDAGLRDRRAARLGAARPRRRADRLGLAVHEDRPRLRRVARARAASSGDAADDERRPGRRAARRSRRRSRRATTSAGRSSPTRSPSRWRSATRPTAPTRSSSRAAPAARSTRSPTTRSAPASGCSPRRPASSPRPPAA